MRLSTPCWSRTVFIVSSADRNLKEACFFFPTRIKIEEEIAIDWEQGVAVWSACCTVIAAIWVTPAVFIQWLLNLHPQSRRMMMVFLFHWYSSVFKVELVIWKHEINPSFPPEMAWLLEYCKILVWSTWDENAADLDVLGLSIEMVRCHKSVSAKTRHFGRKLCLAYLVSTCLSNVSCIQVELFS